MKKKTIFKIILHHLTHGVITLTCWALVDYNEYPCNLNSITVQSSASGLCTKPAKPIKIC